ncbi:GNAT family N-acetyltransferase [Hufsiella ginkgonis]|uniref:GNAT family N-acetyltransferase n=1 Tax=Hufsiella ginkgonis TaxID=2695274 RepID=A0A7K1XX20_9SPHI|nr:GNAT family N-acetyltransferase [Hufsiella ginkgonis]MXV15358.1 GNAT family N-acetyltransferase [Hufsiella ginkgonis]
MDDIQIIRIFEDQVHALRELAVETFKETFAESNTEADMDKYLESALSTGQLTSELENPGSRFYVACEHGEPVGYLKLNFGSAQSDLREEASVEIERIYVKSSHQGKKIGKLLYQKTVEIAKKEGRESIWLGVWEKNARAIAFYRKQGFEEFGEHEFMVGDDTQRDVLMRKALGKPAGVRSVQLHDMAAVDPGTLQKLANEPGIAGNMRDIFPHPYTLNDAETFLGLVKDGTIKQVFAIFEEGVFAGVCSVTPGQDIYRLNGEIGYWIGKPYWNKGIATGAVRLLADYAFRELGLVRVYASVFHTNKASMSVLEKAGFTLEAVIRSSIIKNGELHDEHLYSRLKLS